MRPKLSHALAAILAACVMSLAPMTQAETTQSTPSALAMTGDALFARPALLAMTLVGSAVYVVSLPFSLLGGNASEAGKVLVVDPAKATFTRCLGCTMNQNRQNEQKNQNQVATADNTDTTSN